MKTIKYAAAGLFTFLISLHMQAQKPLHVYEDVVNFNHGSINGFVLEIPEVDYNVVEKAWIKNIEQGTKSKTLIEQGEISIFGAIKKDIYATPVNIYSQITDADTSVFLLACFEVKKDVYITREYSEKEYVKVRNHLLAFGKLQYMKLAEEELRTEEQKLKQLDKEMKSLKGKKNNLEKSINTDKNSISSHEKNIKILKSEINIVGDEIARQSKGLSTMNNGLIKDQRKDQIKELEKQQKKLNRELNSYEDKIVKAKSDINTAEEHIRFNLNDQDNLSKDIELQKNTVKNYKNKLSVIKGY